MNAPTIGEPPKDWMKLSGDVAYGDIDGRCRYYPPNARDGGVVLYEIALDEAGRVTETRGIASMGGFESAARDALAQFRFRAGSYARVPCRRRRTCFWFRTPVGLGPCRRHRRRICHRCLPSSGVSSSVEPGVRFVS